MWLVFPSLQQFALEPKLINLHIISLRHISIGILLLFYPMSPE